MDFDAVLAIMERDTGTHFDPALGGIWTMARLICDRLAGSSEGFARALLEERVREHFEI
jgi:hypothetical protein